LADLVGDGACRSWVVPDGVSPQESNFRDVGTRPVDKASCYEHPPCDLALLSSGSSFWDHAVNRHGEKMKRLCEFNTAMPRFPFGGNIIAFREVGGLHH
jgi:hypothetical protein